MSDIQKLLQIIERSAQRYQLTGDPAPLDDAIDAWEHILSLLDLPSADQSTISAAWNDAGSSYLQRYRARREESDLNRALELFRQAVEATPGHPNLAGHLNNLGIGLINTFGRTGRTEDLEEAITVYRQAVEATPPGHSNLAIYLSNLGIGLSNRFECTGRTEDLEESITVCRQAVKATPPGHPDLAGRLSNLGIRLINTFRRTGRTEDLEESITVFRQAVEATPECHSNLAIYLNNLGNGLMNSFGLTGRMEDLEEAIRVYRQAVKATPPGHLDLAGRLSNLGIGLRNRFGRTGRTEDLEEAITVFRQAVEATPPGHPNLAMYLNNLGIGLRNRFGRTGRTEDLEEGIGSYRLACDLGLHSAPEETLRAGRNWQRWAFQRGSWAEVVEAYDFVEKGMEVRLSHQFSRADKSFSLGGVQGLAAQASYAQLKLGRLDQAVEALEAGRALLMREALERRRRDLHFLKELGYADLYQDFLEASGRYDALLAQAGSETRPSDWMQQVDRASGEIQSAAESIRTSAGVKHPQYRFFLKPLPLQETQDQAHDSPLVYLAATSSEGMALIVNATGLKWIELPELTDAALRETLIGKDAEALGGYLGAYNEWRNGDSNAFDAWSNALDETARWLWDVVMRRIMAKLAAEGITRAVLVPTGLLGLLPLHAAWMEDSSLPAGRRYALDDCTFIYAPSAQALYHARQGADRPADALLVVENPDGSMKFTGPEVKSVLSHFPGRSVHLLRAQATKKSVVRAVGSSSVLHFSGHGLAGWGEAESSRLKLADDDLTLTELFDMHLDQARLAVLSACETGVPGTELPDEAVLLPSAWMQAGVPGVVGSLWSVDDMSTAMLMARFYDLWRDEHLSPPEALRQAQIWLRDGTVKDLLLQFKGCMQSGSVRMSAEAAKSFYKHEKIAWGDPENRPFKDPLYWAAFGYTGL
jgi:CHAT domain-containing protein